MPGREGIYRKRLRIERGLANEFKSCRQFLNGTVSENNHQLQTAVLNNAIEHSLKGGLLKTLNTLCNARQKRTAYLMGDIKVENWEYLVLIIGRMKKWGNLSEIELVEQCLKQYIAEMKIGRRLP